MQDERTVLTVSQLNAKVGQMLSRTFPALWVEGEMSNFVRASSGHWYFSLKDANAQIRCALFKSRTAALQLTPRNGLKVLVRGTVALYEPRGDYQLVADYMEEAGLGALQRAFEALKQRLAQEGLFATEHKRPLPAFPRAIGVITSPTGAAIRDILNVLRRRCPQIPVWVYPVLVQGEGAKEQIVQAIEQADREQRCDVLVLARGGGSLEDLWPFNEEMVARAIHACRTPIVSGVGHEIDFTIADFVADLRAPTPSAAAELVSPDVTALLMHVTRLHRQLQRLQQRHLQQAAECLRHLQQRLSSQRPAFRLQQQAQRLDELDLRLRAALQRYWQRQQYRLHNLHVRLHGQSPLRVILHRQQRLEQQQQYLLALLRRWLDNAASQLRLQTGRLHAFSPLATLERGYSIVQQADGRIVHTAQQLQVGQQVTTRLANGQFDSIVAAIRQE